MESLFSGGELGLLGGGGEAGGLKEDGCGSMAWRSSPLSPDDVYSASHFALISAYQDIKTRLASLERENCGIKRKLKIYEIKFPMISEFGEDSNYCSFESKETALLQSENGSLQQRVNALTHELQKRKEREEQLEDVIQAYEKIHMEKSNVQRDLDKMTSLVEKHVERILSLESALRQRDNSLQKLNSQLHSKDMQYLQLHASPETHMLDCPALTLQSSRSLDALSDLKLQRLEAELEGVRHEAQGACLREEELKAECERLKEEMRQLHNAQREREMTSSCEQCDVEWIKKVGDEQVNLALAYTELTEELGRLQALSSNQTEILRKASQEQASPVQCHSPIHHQRVSSASQRHSPVPQRHSPVPPPPHHSPVPQRRSPAPQRLSPDMHRRSPLLDVSEGPASYSCRPASHHLRASFQGRRSYSEVADPSAYQRPPRFTLDPVSTLPKPRPYIEGYPKQQQQQQPQRVGSPHGGQQHRGSPSPHQGGSGGGGGDGGLGESSMRHSRELPFPLSEVSSHLHFEGPPPSSTAPQPLPQQQQSSEDEEEWACPHPVSPPRTLGVPSSALPCGAIRGPASCSAFPTSPQRPNTLRCHLPGYLSAEHAQSWPSINLWMETEESDIRSCPLCQLIFPVGYPDDALIKHIDSHLENSKI